MLAVGQELAILSSLKSTLQSLHMALSISKGNNGALKPSLLQSLCIQKKKKIPPENYHLWLGLHLL